MASPVVPGFFLRPSLLMTLEFLIYLRALVFSNLAQIIQSSPVFDYVCTVHFYSFVNVSSGNLTAFTYDISWLQVKNFCGTEDEEKHVKITATIETVRSLIVQAFKTGCFPEMFGQCSWAG